MTIEKNYDDGSRKKRKIRSSAFPEVEECVRKWFVQCCDLNLPVSGWMLQLKAEDFAKEMNLKTQFKASNGWLENFKRRHNILFRKHCNESAPAQTASCEAWIEKLPSLLKEYKADDVFSAAETGLFFQCLPNSIGAYEGDKCHGKPSVTVLLAANQSGKEKLPLLIIGRSKRPSCFAKIRSFPMTYRSNAKAWMTNEIFADWLKEIDLEMAGKERHILLFVDNCTSHSNLPILKNITVKYLPSNSTSELQPFKHGIIQSFKVCYRAQIVGRLLDDIFVGKPCTSINILQSMRMADYAWRNVQETAIRKCFIKAGFFENFKMTSGTEEADSIKQAAGDLMNTEQWALLQKKCNADFSFEDFVNVDKSLVTCGTKEDEINTEISDEENELDQQQKEKVTLKAAENAVELLREFLESSDNIDAESFGAIATLEKTVQLQKYSTRRQTLPTDFFF